MNDPLFHQASIYQEDRNFRDALPLWETLVAKIREGLQPDESDFLYTCLISLGECHSELENYPKAISIFEEAVKLGTELREEKLFIPLAELAWLYYEIGNKTQAIDLYKKALNTADDDYTYYILTHLAEIYQYIDFPEAVDCLEQALKLVVQSEDHDNIFVVVEKLIVFHQSSDHFSKAAQYAERGIELLKNTPQGPVMRLQLASVLESTGYINETLKELDLVGRELSLWSEEELDDLWFHEMDMLQIRGNIELKRNNLEGALSFYEQAKSIVDENDSDVLCSVYFEVGQTFLKYEYYQLSEQYLLKTIELARQIEHQLALSEAQARLGTLYYEIGNYEQAIELLEAQAEEERAMENFSALCATLNNLAASYRQIGKVHKAETLFQETGALAKNLSPSDQVLYYQNTSSIHGLWGNHETSLYYAEKALTLATQHDLVTFIPELKKNVGITLYALGHYEAAIARLQDLEHEPLILQFPSKEMSIHNLLGTIYSDAGAIEKAEKHLLKAKEIVETYDIRVSYPTVYNNLGVFYLDMDAYRKAEPLFKKALEMDKALGQITQLSTDYHNLGFLYHDQARYEKALPYFEKAIRVKENLRQQGGDQQRLSYQDQEYNTYELLVDTLIRLGKEEQALEILERYKNRELLRKMQLSPEQSLTFETVQSLLSPNTCLIILGNSRNDDLIGFAINKSQTRAITISLRVYFDKAYPGDKKSQAYLEKTDWFVPPRGTDYKQEENQRYQRMRHRSNDAKKLAALIHYYRYRLNRDSRLWHSRKVKTDREIGFFLYDLLLAPFQEYIQNAQQLVIIADDLLELIPYDTLVRPDDTYMAESFTIQQVPSVGVLKHLSRKTSFEKIQKILAYGISDYSYTKQAVNFRSQDSDEEKLEEASIFLQKEHYPSTQVELIEWVDLPFAKNEITAISNSNFDVSTLDGNILTPQKIKEYSINGHLSNFDVLHFAIHAISVPDHPDQSALVLYQDGLNNPTYLFLPAIEQLVLKSQLVFLSACETALGKLYSGDATASITNAFLVAGSRNVIATLWPVHDEYTMLFVKEFYEQLGKNPPSEALAITKRQCISGVIGEELRKAVYWGAFVLYGGIPRIS